MSQLSPKAYPEEAIADSPMFQYHWRLGFRNLLWSCQKCRRYAAPFHRSTPEANTAFSGHPWVTTIKKTLNATLYPDVFRRLPYLKLWPSLIRPEGLASERKKHFSLSHEKVQERMLKDNDRDDFFAHLLSEKATDLRPEFLAAQANTLVVAGSETTATFLTGAYPKPRD